MSRLAALSVTLASLPLFAAEPPLVAPTEARTPADERAAFKLPPGFNAQLVASEPDIQKPMQIAFDAKGRLWVTTSRQYPFPAAGRPGTDKLFVLSDFGPDGKARKVSVFADDLNIPIGILPLPDCKSVHRVERRRDPEARPTPTATARRTRRKMLFTGFGIRDTHGMVQLVHPDARRLGVRLPRLRERVRT